MAPGEFLDVHLFPAGGLCLAFVPATDGLFLVDEAGWDALTLARRGMGPAELRRLVADAHGGDVAERCLEELEAVRSVAAHDPFLAAGTRDDGDGLPAEAWLPSSPDAPRLKALCLNVSHDCDLACRYCFAGRGSFGGRRSLMTAEVGRAAVDFLLAHAGDVPVCEIDFFGGEPLLNLEVVREVVDYARRRGKEQGKAFGFTLTTNAFTLGPDEAAYLDETMDNVVLSLDGRPRVHDRMRPAPGGRPTHARVLENVKRFVAGRGDRDYWVRGTFTAHNLDFSADVAYLAGEGFRNISLEPAVGGAGVAAADGWRLTAEHVDEVRAEYFRLADLLFDLEERGRRVVFFHFITEADEGPCYAKRVRGCGAGREYMAVTPDGDLYPCHQFAGAAEYRAGSVFEGLSGGHGPAGRVARLWLGAKPSCRSCWARYRCSGGCHANGLAATGSLTDPDPLGCAFMKARLEAALYLEARRTLAGMAPAAAGPWSPSAA